MRNSGLFLCVLVFLVMLSAYAGATETTHQVSQYGITWTFDKEYPIGQFVNGDWWVVGPVTVVGVSPAPGLSDGSDNLDANSIYGAGALEPDNRMRNGSMIIVGPDYTDGDHSGYGKQGYDSRAKNYSNNRSITFPCTLSTNRSLISTVSNTNLVNGNLETPYILGQSGIWLTSPTQTLALERAAVLTCLDQVPPVDAFRPPYAGTDKPLYRWSDVDWALLPDLPALPSSPNWTTMARIFQRPWLDHIQSWIGQYTLPGLNGPNYGREFSRMSSLAALMLLQDVPLETKEPLMIGYLQLGIDLSGLSKAGRQWFADGGHWQGRKWPILFSSLMLDAPELRSFPAIDLSRSPYASITVLPSEVAPSPTTLFQEDMDFYYGKGGDGQENLWQIVFHSYPRTPHQETPHDQYSADQQFVQNYYVNNVGALSGAALATQLMGARQIWNHDAFLDHLNYWMLDGIWWDRPSWMPASLEKVWDDFVEDMWDAYYADIPEQPIGTNNMKWIWKYGATGCWEPNFNPNEPQYLFIEVGQPDPKQVVLNWTSAPGRAYSVYGTTNLMENFYPMETNMLWPQNSWTNIDPVSTGSVYYRLQVDPVE